MSSTPPDRPHGDVRGPSLDLSEKSQQVQKMFDAIAPRYDLLNRLLSARQDVRWRKAMVARLPAPADGGGVLYDVACGTGDVMLEVGSARADYERITGFDISAEMIAHGRERKAFAQIAERRACSAGGKARPLIFDFKQASAESLPVEDASADALTISFGLRNVDDRMAALREFHRALRPGGMLCVLEFFPSESTAFAKIFDFYFKSVLPRVGGLISDRAAYEYLPRSVATMPSGDAFKRILEDAGFSEVSETRWLAGATRLFVARKVRHHYTPPLS